MRRSFAALSRRVRVTEVEKGWGALLVNVINFFLDFESSLDETSCPPSINSIRIPHQSSQSCDHSLIMYCCV